METEKTKAAFTTQNNQPIKTITHQEIYTTKETLGKLQSWISILEIFDNFFSRDYENGSLSKKELIQEYYAISQIFGTFLEDFLKQTHQLETQLEDLRTREKFCN